MSTGSQYCVLNVKKVAVLNYKMNLSCVLSFELERTEVPIIHHVKIRDRQTIVLPGWVARRRQ